MGSKCIHTSDLDPMTESTAAGWRIQAGEEASTMAAILACCDEPCDLPGHTVYKAEATSRTGTYSVVSLYSLPRTDVARHTAWMRIPAKVGFAVPGETAYQRVARRFCASS